jgi:hypothetical protein
MKYMLLAYTSLAEWESVDVTSPEFRAMCDFYERLGAELTESGELVMTEGLADPAFTRTVRPAEGGTAAVDGPYAEMKEVLASFSIIDCAGHERAMEIARRVVEAVGDTVEVRPVGQGPAPEL